MLHGQQDNRSVSGTIPETRGWLASRPPYACSGPLIFFDKVQGCRKLALEPLQNMTEQAIHCSIIQTIQLTRRVQTLSTAAVFLNSTGRKSPHSKASSPCYQEKHGSRRYVYKIYDIIIGIMETVQIPAWVMQAVHGWETGNLFGVAYGIHTSSIQITYSLVY